MQCSSLHEDIPSILHKGALIPATTVCQIISEAILHKTNLDPEFVQLIKQYLPTSVLTPASPIAFLWSPYTIWDSDDEVRRYYDLTLSLGVETLSISERFGLCQNPLTVQTDDILIDRLLRIQDYYGGTPFHLNANYGIQYLWKGSPGNPCIERMGVSGAIWNTTGPYNVNPYNATLDPCASDILDVYHTNIIDYANTMGGLENLIEFQYRDPAGRWAQSGGTIPGPPPAPIGSPKDYHYVTEAMLCSNYRGIHHTYAMEKFEEIIKWLKPTAIHFDIEMRKGATASNWFNSLYTYNYDGHNGHQTNDDCALCAAAGNGDGTLGYANGMAGIASALASVIRNHVTNPIITNLGVQNFPDGYPNNQIEPYFYMGNSFTNGAPGVYYIAAYARDQGISITESFNYYQSGAGGVNTWGYLSIQPEALCNSYVWVCPSVNSWGAPYLTNDEFYELCYLLAQNGALGFIMWPAITGVNSNFSTGIYSADDAASIRLIPVGIQAFKEYRRLNNK